MALVVQIATGLTWTRFAGKWVDAVKGMLAAEPATVSAQLPARAPDSAGDAGWDRVDAVVAAARQAGLARPLEVSPPSEPGQAWTVATVDTRWPIETTTVAVDPATAAITDRVSWAEQPAVEKATLWAIYFHTGKLFGLANQVFLTLLSLAVIALVGAGYRMWWHRRPAGELGAPLAGGPVAAHRADPTAGGIRRAHGAVAHARRVLRRVPAHRIRRPRATRTERTRATSTVRGVEPCRCTK